MLSPLPLDRLVARAFDEIAQNGSIYDLPAKRFFFGDPRFATTIHGRPVAAPLGPSAGPHTQLAQNIALGWLAGARVFELKTIQIQDRLRIPRPCIDARHVGLNVEWSQELTLEQSLEEYVKASMLIDLLAGHFSVARGSLFDISVGYDLGGITSERITQFLDGLRDATPTVDRLRKTLKRETDFTTNIANSVTLSTFHGCPVAEIERIADFLLTRGFDTAIKLNPTLLGRETVTNILQRLGFRDLVVPQSAFDNDPALCEAMSFVTRLRKRAKELGRSFAIKLTNTLVVENHSSFLPRSEALAYLSGPPLHVLAMHLVQRFRHAFGRELPISFSAGIDRANYPEAVRLGLAPVTVCTDLLQPGGYARLHGYATELANAMHDAHAHSIAAFATGDIDAYVASIENDLRYRCITRPPRKTGHAMSMFECSLCDLCIPACPNDALFRIPSPRGHEVACFADFCNDCGNCETFCPDGGAPSRVKLRYFGSAESWRRNAPEDGFSIDGDRTLARIGGVERIDDPLIAVARDAVLDRAHVNYINAREES